MFRQFLRQYRLLLMALILVLVGLHLFSSSIENPAEAGFFTRMVLTIYEPIYKLINYPFSKTANFFSNLTSISSLREENERLAAQNQTLQQELNDKTEDAEEAKRTAGLLKLYKKKPEAFTFARVIARPSSGEYRVLIIDKGLKDGVEKNTCVQTEKGLVGHVIQASSYASKVLLITDAKSSVPALVQRTRANSLVQGLSTDQCRLRFLQRTEDIAAGDIVVTSGLGGVFPKGLVIGTISDVRKKDFGIYQDAELTTAVDLDTVEEVALIKVPDVGVMDLLPDKK